MAHFDLNVSGMSCQHCVARVKKAVSKLDGVTNVEVDLASGAVAVDAAEGRATREQVAAAIVDAGYDVNG